MKAGNGVESLRPLSQWFDVMSADLSDHSGGITPDSRVTGI